MAEIGLVFFAQVTRWVPKAALPRRVEIPEQADFGPIISTLVQDLEQETDSSISTR
jgi:hypothetical protein